MGRKRREFSSTDFYHIVMRGINRQQIFQEENDYNYFYGILDHAFTDYGCTIAAYCLMGNHFHLLAKIPSDRLSLLIGEIASSYVRWYNAKYDRCGPLFQGRFFSSPVETQQAFLSVLRYIVQNPYRAGLETSPGERYRRSSFRAYMGYEDRVTETKLAQSMFGDHKALIRFLQTPASASDILPLKTPRNISDGLIWQLFHDMAGINNTEDFLHLDTANRRELLKCALKYRIPMKQLTRLTAMSETQIRRICAE